MKNITEKIMAITGGYNWAETNRFYPSSAVSDPRKISYLTEKIIKKAAEQEDWCFDMGINGSWYVNSDTREKYGIMAKPGKFFRTVCPDAKDSDIQKMVSKWYAVVPNEKKEFLVSEDIKKYYHHSSYYSQDGSLGNSCMKGGICQSYLEFYENYSVKILILKSGDKIKGRALLWEGVYFPHLENEYTFMDRIYVNNDNDTLLFKNYAEKHGLVYKSKQSYSDKDGFVYQDDKFTDCIEIVCNGGIADEFPYLDTMSYMNSEGDLCNEESTEYDTNLDSTTGGYTDGSNTVCEDCGGRFDPDTEGIYVEGHGHVCENCAYEYHFCTHCEEYHHSEYITIIQNGAYCDTCRDNNFTYCEFCEEYYPDDEVYEFNGDNYCEECHSDNVWICDGCDDDCLRTDLKDHNNETLCPDCLKEAIEQEEKEQEEVA